MLAPRRTARQSFVRGGSSECRKPGFTICKYSLFFNQAFSSLLSVKYDTHE